MATNAANDTGLKHIWDRIITLLSNKVDKVTGKGLSTNDYTTAEKSKLDGIESGAQVNTVNSDDISGSKTVTGNPITLTDGSETYAEELVMDLDPIQDLHGYDKPWVGGAGKNILPITMEDGVTAGVTYTKILDNDGNVIGVKCQGQISGTTAKYLCSTQTLPAGTYRLSAGSAVSQNGIRVVANYNSSIYRECYTSNGIQFTLSEQTRVSFYMRGGTSGTDVDVIVYPMLCLSTATNPTTFAPYTNISPIQGYDIVSMDRCGKNLLPMTVEGIKAKNTEGTWSGNVYTLSGVTFTVLTDENGCITGIRCNGNSSGSLVFYLFSGSHTISSNCKYNVSASKSSSNWDTTVRNGNTDIAYINAISGVNGDVAVTDTTFTFAFVYFNASFNDDIILHPMIRDANVTDPTYEPYNGQTVSLQLGNKNLLPMTVEGIKAANSASMFSWSGNVCTVYGGTITILTDENGNVTGYKVNDTFNTDTYFVLASGLTKSGNTILNGCPSGGATNTYMLFASSPRKYDTGNGVEITDLSNSTIYLYIEHGQNMSNKIFYPMVRDANIVDPTFSPYNPTLGDMVYGGQLTLNDDGSAVFVGDKGYKDLGDLTWGYNSQYSLFYSYLSDGKKTGTGYGLDSALCSAYNVSTANHREINNGKISVGNNVISSTTCGVVIKDTRYTDATAFETAVTGQTLVYELATPFTIYLSAEQLKLLQGTNNVWSNAGDVTLKYQPDNVIAEPKAEIQKLKEVTGKTKLYVSKTYKTTAANTWEYTGMKVTIPPNSIYSVFGEVIYAYGRPSGARLSNSDNVDDDYCVMAECSGGYVSYSGITRDDSLDIFLYERRVVVPLQANRNRLTAWYEPAIFIYENIKYS